MWGPSSTPTDGPLAAARGLGKRYADGTRALAAVDLDVRAGELVAVVGANGSGKTTLLRLLAGAIAPSEGTLTLLGDPAGTGRRAVRAAVSYVPQEQALDPEMTVVETLRLFGALHGMGRDRARARAEKVAGELDLAPHLFRAVASLSGGLRQRLHLALGLLHAPRLALLDEPTAGLDRRSRDGIWEALHRTCAAGGAVLLVTHDLADAERHAGRVIVLKGGRVVADAAPAPLVAAHPPDLDAVFYALTGERLPAGSPPAEGSPGPGRGGGGGRRGGGGGGGGGGGRRREGRPGGER